MIWFIILELDMRLEGGTSSQSGRVEIFHDGIWGTICDDGWDNLDARIVCSYLGFSGISLATGNAAFGEGAGQIWLDDVSCMGDETSLNQCSHADFGIHNCFHNEDAGVECDVSEDLLGGWYE